MEDFARADESLLGRVIAGKFGLKSCIGVGASGAVYQADQLALGRTVAVKILRPELTTDSRFAKRFHDEALAASRLNHPNTVSVIDYGQTEDGLLYLVMEYLRGKTLAQLVGSEKLDGPRIADILMQILSGLEEAHEAGVVHADLKTENIVVEHRRGGWDLVKVVDFGIARLLGAGEDRTTAERTICGTPEYMAPEVIQGRDPTFASDIYAVGVLLYELLVGRTPFSGRDTMQVLTRHLEEEPTSPSSLVPERAIDPRLEQAALRALAKSPEERFATAAELREAIAPVGRLAQSGERQVLCSGCGVTSLESFKFCPECGEPRANIAEGNGPAEAAPGELAPVRDDAFEAPTNPDIEQLMVTQPTREFTVEERSAGGILPLPLLGRDRELDELTRFLTGGGGERRTLQIAGPSGSGKSRLVREACARLDSAAVAIYIASPDPSGLRAAFFPIRSLVAGVLRLPPVCSYDELSAAVLDVGLTERDLPGIAELFGHPAGISELDPPVRRRELVISTVRALHAASRHREIILIFEDIDDYDHPSQDVLRRLVEHGEEHQLRLVITSGPDLSLRWPGLGAHVALGRLEAPAVAALAAHLGHKGHQDMPSAETLEAMTSGLPGHIHQLARYIIEGGSAQTAPEGLADLIAARLELLPHEVRLTCQAAAAFGREVAPGSLRAALAGRVEESALAEALSVLSARVVLQEEAGLLVFEESLVREVVYDSIPADVRRELHDAALHALRGPSRDPVILGHHLELSGNLVDAADALTRAGDEAVRQLDDRGACQFFNRALACARRVMLTEGEEQNRGRFIITSAKLADALRATGELGLARGVVQEAQTYCAGAADLRAHLHRALSHLESVEGNLRGATENLREAIGTAITTGQRDLLVFLYLDLATVYVRARQASEAMNELDEGINLVTFGEGASSEDGPDPLWRMLLRLATLRGGVGHHQQALDLARHARRHAERVGTRAGIARAHATMAEQLEHVGDLRAAAEHQQRAVEELRHLGDRRGTAELLLAGVRPTLAVHRLHPTLVSEARLLAEEVGWSEGVRRADEASSGVSE